MTAKPTETLSLMLALFLAGGCLAYIGTEGRAEQDSPASEADELQSAVPQAEPDAAMGEWPQFRGPGGLATSLGRGVPVTWTSEENLVWKTELPGPGSSSPITLGNRVFVTCYTGYGLDRQQPGDMQGLKRHLLCIDRANGTILWDKTAQTELPEQPYKQWIPRHGYASSTPAADSQRVYAFFGKSGVLAFDYDGRRLWHADVGSQIHGYGSGASPVLHKGLVIVNACVESESLVALDKRTGKEVWRAKGIRNAWNTPLLVELPSGGTELAVEVNGELVGFDPATGERLWTCETGIHDYVCPSVVAHDGIVYSLGGRSGSGLAVRAGGRGDVTQTHLLWKGTKRGPNVPSPVYHDGHLYFATDSAVVRCLDAKTGEIVYEKRLEHPSGDMWPSPVLADGKLYYVSSRGRTFVLAAKPQFEQLAHNDLGDVSLFNASPAVSHGQLLLRSDRFLHCIGTRH